MTAPESGNTPAQPQSSGARNLQWLLGNLVKDVAGVRSVAVVSSDGVPMLASDPSGTGARGADLAAVVSGLGGLTSGASQLADAGAVKQTVITMDRGSLLIMAISDGSLLGVHAAEGCDTGAVVYEMALFVGRAGHVLTPELRHELTRATAAEAAAR